MALTTRPVISVVFATVRLGLLLSLAAVASRATALSPGETISLTGTTLLDTPGLAGTVIADTTASFAPLPGPPPFNSPPPIFRGVVEEWVLRESATSTLDFYYQVTLDPSSQIVSPAPSTEFFGTSDLQLTTDVDFLSDGPGAGGTGSTARRLGGRQLITFFIGEPDVTGPPINAVDASRKFFIRTNATDFSLGGNF